MCEIQTPMFEIQTPNMSFKSPKPYGGLGEKVMSDRSLDLSPNHHRGLVQTPMVGQYFSDGRHTVTVNSLVTGMTTVTLTDRLIDWKPS